ncbi:MAG: hypothetical protein WA148_07295 [Actinomycetota bacterium]
MQWSQESVTHLKEHVNWPATGSQIVESCNTMAHVPEAERKLAMGRLNRNKTYNTPEEAMADLEK